MNRYHTLAVIRGNEVKSVFSQRPSNWTALKQNRQIMFRPAMQMPLQIVNAYMTCKTLCIIVNIKNLKTQGFINTAVLPDATMIMQFTTQWHLNGGKFFGFYRNFFYYCMGFLSTVHILKPIRKEESHRYASKKDRQTEWVI